MNALQLPFNFDAAIILKEISQFTKEDYYDIYNTSVEVETLWSKHLIEPKIGSDNLPHFHTNEALKKSPYLLSILDTFQCKKETFRIHTLNAKAHIRPHREMGYCLEKGIIRIHIPIVTYAKVELLVNNERINMKVGECWYCNFNEKHEVKNNSELSRTHLIMDCIVNDWVKEMFKNKCA
jgi:hypothetical protein